MEKTEVFEAIIIFNGDRSVGVSPRVYTMQLDMAYKQPFQEEEALREEYRQEIKKLYQSMYEEICHVSFSFESQA